MIYIISTIIIYNILNILNISNLSRNENIASISAVYQLAHLSIFRHYKNELHEKIITSKLLQ